MQRTLSLMLQSQLQKHFLYNYYITTSPPTHLLNISFWNNSTWSKAPEKQEHKPEISSWNRKMRHTQEEELGWCGHGKVNVGLLFNFQRWIHRKGKHFSSYMWVLHINHFTRDRGKKLEKIKSTNNSPFQCLCSELNDPAWPNHCFPRCTLNINTE